MLLSQTAEYAMRAMAWMATRPAGEAVRSRDLSKATDIPTHYLSKILRRLVVSGLLESQKGHGGGFTLAKPREQIRFMDILAATDAAPPAGECAFGWGECDEENPCPLHPAWAEISTAFYQWADRTTLAEVDPAHADNLFPRLGRPRPG